MTATARKAVRGRFHWRHGPKPRLLPFLIALTALFACGLSHATTCADGKTDIAVVYWSAQDCHWCTYWESSLSGMKAQFERSAAIRRTSYFTIKRKLTAVPPAASDYPEELSWLRDRIAKNPKSLKLGVPAWEIYVNRESSGRWWGTQAWDETKLPEMKSIIDAACP